MATRFLLDGPEGLGGTVLGLGTGVVDTRERPTLQLDGAEGRHAATVRRLRVGEPISVGDGRGTVAWGSVTSVESGRVEVLVDRVTRTSKPTARIVLVQALAKGDRDELAVQAATELGVDIVIPWSAERSVSRWQGTKVERGTERWRSIVREATKQSLRAVIPEVRSPIAVDGLLDLARSGRMLVLEPTASVALTRWAVDPADDRDILLVVGPEGGISDREREALAAAGAVPVTLGDSVLRTSTAGPAAIAVLSALLHRW